MDRNNRKPKCLKAFTIAELLIYMIIAGIIFLSVMEGFSLMVRYSAARTEKIVSGSEYYNGYHRLTGLAMAADSISAGEYDDIVLFLRGVPSAGLSVADSLLIAEKSGLRDTLLRNVARMRIIASDNVRNISDTLCIEVSPPGSERLRIGFGITPPREKSAERDILENEKDYNYE